MSNANRKPGDRKEAPAEPLQALPRRLHARHRAKSRPRGELRVRPAGADGRQGAAAGAAAQAQPAGRRRDPRPFRFHGAAARLPRRRGASPPRAGRPGRPRRLRRDRAGARRGDRRAPHERRRRQPLGHARGPLPSRRQIRGDHRPRRRAGRGRARPARARAPDRPQAAGGGPQDRRSVARLHRGARRPRPRRAHQEHREPAHLRALGARAPRLAGDGRRRLPRPER